MKRWRAHAARATDGAAIGPLAVLFGLNAADELDRAAFGILLPEIREEFGLDLSGVLTVVSLVALIALLLQVPVAVLAERFPRTRVAATGALAWAVCSALTGLAPTLLLLGAARAGSGIGKAVIDPTHNALLADYYPIGARPKVFALHRAANSVGAIVGPISAGMLASAFGWRVPFVVLAVPSVVLAIAAARLPEPGRGGHERAAAGATGAARDTDEPAPSFAEAWRIVWQIDTLRRIWWALPFLAASLIGFASLAGLAYDDLFGLDERARGFALAAVEPAQLVGLALGARVGVRRLAEGPQQALGALSRTAGVVALALGGFALAPNLATALACHALAAAGLGMLAPGIITALAAVIPPRARSMGFSVASLWIIPGLLALPVIGAIGDRGNLRIGLLGLVPMFVVGAVLLARARETVASDVEQVRQAAAARSADAAARHAGAAPRLAVRGLDVGYEGVQVLFGVDLEVGAGECVALLGTNGAGKSTLLRAVAGTVEARAGVVLLDGREITHAPPNEIAALGVAQVPGGHGVFASLSVGDNLRTAAWRRRRRRADVDAFADAAFDLFPALAPRAGDPAGDLSGGQRQMLALAMALAERPALLLIDELSLGLAPSVVTQLVPVLEAARRQGTAIVLVEQSVQLALTLADTAVFLEKGEVRYRGPAAGLLDRPDVLRSVFLDGAATAFGQSAPASARAPATPTMSHPAPLLEAHQLTVAFGGVQAVDDVTLAIAPGELVGVIGANGAGKTTLFDLLSGVTRPDSGRVVLNGRDVTRLGAAGRSRLGLGRSFQDARLFPALTVTETIAAACHRWIHGDDVVSAALGLPNSYDAERAVRRRADELLDMFGLGRYRSTRIRELSTGVRHIVELACVVAHQPSVVLLDEPSAGIAQRETEALVSLLREVRDLTGAALVVIEHDMALVRAVADRLVALDAGRLIADGPLDVVLHDPHVVAAYLGDPAPSLEASTR